MTLSNNLAELSLTVGIELLYLREYLERIVRVAAEMLNGIDVSAVAEWCAVSLDIVLIACTISFQGTLTHHCVTDNDCRTLGFFLSGIESLANLVDVITVYLDYVPAPSLVLGTGVLTHDNAALGRELDVVRVIEHYKVVESEVSGYTTNALANLFLNAAIRDVSVDLVLHDGLAETSLKELLSNGSTSCDGMTLSQRTAGVLDATLYIQLWVTRSRRAPLAELLELVEGELSAEAQC